MEKKWIESVDKLVRNRFPQSNEEYEEFMEGLDETGRYLFSKGKIDNLSEYIAAIIKVFDNENIVADYVASVEDLIFALVEDGYTSNLGLLSILIDNLGYFVSNAEEWGGEIFKKLFYMIETENEGSLENISSILNDKDEKIRKMLKEFILNRDFESSSMEKKIFADKCLAILS